MRVLIVEDDPSTRDTLARGLEEELFHVETAGTGATAQDLAEHGRFDVIMLDVVLPDVDGVTLCRRLRVRGIDSPILLLTGRGAVADRVRGLDAGADDYLVKPFVFDELLARIRALGRRGRAGQPGATFIHGPIELDLRDRTVTLNGQVVDLTATEFRLLACLMRRPHAVISREDLAHMVWAGAIDHSSNVIDVYVGYLRKKLGGPGFPVVRAVRGAGYTLAKVSP
jgi:DNA-binding response OmpR family regulator